jgi:gluconokinase
VSGVGKTTIGKALAASLHWSFVDGDDLHPPSNVAKMKRGEPLDDRDRRPWLSELHQVIEDHRARAAPLVLCCSALKASYRQELVGDTQAVVFVYLWAAPDVIAARLEQRRGHFMPPTLLASQFDTLEPPVAAIAVEVDRPVAETVETIVRQLDLR